MFVFMYNQVPTEVFLQGAINYINSLDMKEGFKNSLTDKLNSAFHSIREGNTIASINKLNAVINQVNAQKGKGIKTNQGIELIRVIQDTIVSINSK
jgi:hypothetical protein